MGIATVYQHRTTQPLLSRCMRVASPTPPSCILPGTTAATNKLAMTKTGLLSISSWVPSLGRLSIAISKGRVMYAGLASGYSFSLQVRNGAADTKQHPPQPLEAGASGAVINTMLPVSSPAQGSDAYPQAVRLWDKLAVSQLPGSAVNDTATIQLHLRARTALPAGVALSITGLLGVAANAAAVARGKAASPPVGALLALDYTPEHAPAAALGAFATWIPGIVQTSMVMAAGLGPASILLTLATELSANKTLAVSFTLQTALVAQSAQTLSLALKAGDASPLVARYLDLLPLGRVPPPWCLGHLVTDACAWHSSRAMEDEGSCDTTTLYLNSMRLFPLNEAPLPPFACVRWNKERGLLTMEAHGPIVAGCLPSMPLPSSPPCFLFISAECAKSVCRQPRLYVHAGGKSDASVAVGSEDTT